MKEHHLHEEISDDQLLKELGFDASLIVHNDDINTFDWVITSLVDICSHNFAQAEQCALLIHFKGKYAVKNGMKDVLRPMKNSLIERGISATIQEN